MKIIFILSLVSLLVLAVAGVLKERKYSRLVRYAACAITVVFAIVSGIAESYLMPLCIGVAIFSAVSLGLSILAERIKQEGFSKFVGFMAKAMLFVVLIEAVCFNFNSFHLWKGGYEETSLNIENAAVSGMTLSGGGYITTEETASIEFTGLNQKIGVIKLDVTGTEYKTDYSIDFTDETNASYYMRSGLVKGSVFNDIEATKYIVCDFSGKVGNLRINLTGLSDNHATIKAVTLNADYPASFSYLRFAIILLGIAFVWAFKRSVNFRKPLGKQPMIAKSVTAVLIICVVILSYVLSSVNLHPETDFSMDTGNQITQELVDALEKGEVELKDKPNEQLLSMENPYDWSARTEQNVSAKWDHVLYNGKYYSYYGIGPVILLYMPFHLITGHYLESLVGVLLFNTIALIFLGMTFYKLMKKLFPISRCRCIPRRS
ncbi:MAG: hypothetical protein IJ639_07945 [Ruminococcus sp.]|nr:hypothetical protein [Ruminococcus sp.]